MTPRARFLATLPRKRVTAGVLLRDDAGRVLLVEPTYRDDWLLPGGSVESGESPASGAAREVQEELGLPLAIGRPLVLHSIQRDDDPDGVLHFVYDGGAQDAVTIARFRLPGAELRSHRFVGPARVGTLASASTAKRVAAALDALASGALVELSQ